MLIRHIKYCGGFTTVLGEFPWRHHTNETFYSLGAERATTRFIWRELCAVLCPPRGTGRVGTESGDRACCTLSVVRCPSESLGVVSDLCERDRQCQNTLGEPPRVPRIRLRVRTRDSSGPLLNIWEKKWQQRDRSHWETTLLSTPDLCLGRQRHHHVHGRGRHDNRHLQLQTRLVQWLRALKF